MRTFKLDKLIRDKVLDNMKSMGQTVKYRTLDDAELLVALKAKLLEETKEFDPADPKALKELADILEAVETAAGQLGADLKALQTIQAELRKERGGFDGKVFVETVTLDDNDKWVKYYESEPDRFPEITEDKV